MPTATTVEVVDASALAALLFGEPEAGQVVDRLRSGRLVAPTLLDYELGNICLTKIRRHPAQREALLRGLALRDRMAIEAVAVDQREVVPVAEAAGLTAYDASYLGRPSLAGSLRLLCSLLAEPVSQPRAVSSSTRCARLVAAPEAWPWSSARAHLAGRDDGLVTVVPLLEAIGGWRAFLDSGLPEEA